MPSGFILKGAGLMRGPAAGTGGPVASSGTDAGAESSKDAPRWDLSEIYTSPDSDEFLQDWQRLKELIGEVEALASGPDGTGGDPGLGPAAGSGGARLASGAKSVAPALNGPYAPDGALAWLRKSLAVGNECANIAGTLGSYLYCLYSTDTTNSKIMAKLNALETLMVPLAPAQARFRNALAAAAPNLGLPNRLPEDLEYASLYLSENLVQQTRQMSPEQEDLAADLARSGGDAWSRLQEQLSSTLTRVWDQESGQTKTVVELRSLAYDADRAIRQKAYRLELEAWKATELPFAAALNGVKGTADSLNKRRRYASAIEKSLFQNRITRPTLDALVAAMEESLPDFRRYFSAKAKKLGLPKLSFYDIFAPLPAEKETVWTYQAAREFIVERFGDFSGELADFAAMAFDRGWIDAEPRSGKVGGAYCIDFPARKVSRVLANFDGSFSSVSTLAHELGHAYHSWLLRDEPVQSREYPMTLAETASIFCETIVYNGALDRSSGSERLKLLEMLLSESAQVVVDILSRYYFETEVFKIRGERELAPEEFCQLMLDAQERTYGSGLNPEERHAYMWAVKGHYYSPELGFYNYPYAFGQLFGLGLYAQFVEQPKEFPSVYSRLLGATGRMDAITLCKSAGFDIETPDFWRNGISAIVAHINEFCKEVDQA